mmetsp:Transcript_10133/g.22433  ORF Transcript_10133/g.22433 Transcript_10133/m.22433 type:complete len:364 (+) Transcript_10133:41-1132(+)
MGTTSSAHPSSAAFCCEDDEGGFDCCDVNNKRRGKLRTCHPGGSIDSHETLLGQTLSCGFDSSAPTAEEEALVSKYLDKLTMILDPNDSGFITGGDLLSLCERLESFQGSRSTVGLSKELRRQLSGNIPVGEALRFLEIWLQKCGYVDVISRAEVLRHMISESADMVLDDLIEKLFTIQDLNADGVLEETELVQLNKKVAMLHKGKHIDKAAVEERYRTLFRTKLDPDGSPVSLARYRQHIADELGLLDPDPVAQIAIMEQWLLEASFARSAFRDPSFHSLGDVPFLLLEGLKGQSGDGANSTHHDETTTQASSPRLQSPRGSPGRTRVPYPSEQGSSFSSVGELLDAFNLSFLSTASSKSGL